MVILLWMLRKLGAGYYLAWQVWEQRRGRRGFVRYGQIWRTLYSPYRTIRWRRSSRTLLEEGWRLNKGHAVLMRMKKMPLKKTRSLRNYNVRLRRWKVRSARYGTQT